jgi:hypothetical protein
MHQGHDSPGVLWDEDREQAKVLQLLRRTLSLYTIRHYHLKPSLLVEAEEHRLEDYGLAGFRHTDPGEPPRHLRIPTFSILDHG